MSNTTSSLHRDRLQWIDISRGFVICLMIVGHCIQFGSGQDFLSNQLFYDNSIFKFIYSFHMPLFMIISGYLFGFSAKKQCALKHKIGAVLIPAIIWSMIRVVLILGRAIIHHEFSFDIILRCINIIFTYYWFLWALFFCILVVLAVNKFFNNLFTVYLIIFILLLVIPDWLNTDLWKYMYPYFVAGFLWNIKKPNIAWLNGHRGITTIVLIGIFSLFFAFYDINSFVYTTRVAIRSIDQFGIDLYRYAIGFIGSGMILWIIYCLYPIVETKFKYINVFLSYCGRISLLIYLVDCLINSYILPRVTQSLNLNYIVVIIESIMILLICFVINWIINQIPFAKKILLGDR